MDRAFFSIGAVLGAIGVAAGAFGAHGLKGWLTPEMLTVFETGVRYHLIHALGLLAVAWAATRWASASIRAAGWLFVVGILLFSGTTLSFCIMPQADQPVRNVGPGESNPPGGEDALPGKQLLRVQNGFLRTNTPIGRAGKPVPTDAVYL